MKIKLFISICFVCINTVALASDKPSELDACSSVDSCIERVYEVAQASKTSGISKKQGAVANKLASFGEEAVERVIPLLTTSEPHERNIFAYTIRNVKNIDQKHLSKIIEALDSKNNLGWLPAALGRINSPKAAEEAVKRFVGSQSAPHNQEAYAVKLSGERALPFILQAASCTTPCGERDHYHLGYVLGEMPVDMQKEAYHLLAEPLFDEKIPLDTKEGILLMLRLMKLPANNLEDDLLSLRSEFPDLSKSINDVLISVSSVSSIDVLEDRLYSEPSPEILASLAKIGKPAKSSGDKIISLLDHEEIEMRYAAVQALGFIGYERAIPRLIEMLNDLSSVSTTWVAAESLGRLRSESSAKELKNASRNHWFPAVREAAQRAIKNLRSGTEYQSTDKNDSSFRSYFFRGWEDIDACKTITLKTKEESQRSKLYDDYASDELKALAYQSVIIGFGAADEAAQLAEDPDAIIHVTNENMVEHREYVQQVPNLALQVDDGWLAGSDRGEWGGELVFISDKRTVSTILEKNIEDIYKIGDRYVAVTGLAHLGLNEGEVYELDKVLGEWTAHPWRELPGAPITSWLVETGELLVNTYGGGSVLVSPNGRMSMATCVSSAK